MQLLFLHQWISDETLKALGWTFIHSLWQGLLAAVIAAVILTCTRKAAATLRYNLLGLVMILFLITTGITFYLEQAKDAVSASSIVSSGTVSTGAYFVPGTNDITTLTASTSYLDAFISWFNTNADLFVMIWLLFFLVNCLKLFTGLASVHRLRHYKTQAPDELWIAKLRELSTTLGLKQKVSLLQSQLVKVPVAVGFLKPVILIPMGLLSHLPPEQVETILLHELAHIRRRDYIVNVVQRIAEAIFFFNPAFIWISSLLRHERESCCDDIVIGNTSYRRNYLDALVSFQEYASSSSGYAMAIGNKRYYLLERVKRMITQENRRLGWMERIALLSGVVLLTAFTFISKADADKVNEESKDRSPIELSNQHRGEQAHALDNLIVASKFEEGTTGVGQRRTTVMVEPAKRLQLRRKDIQNLVSMTFQPRDTPRVKIANALIKERNYTIMNASLSIDKKKNRKEMIIAKGKDGRVYRIRKFNHEVVDLHIDGKEVDEKEFHQYENIVRDILDEKNANDKNLPTGKEWEVASKDWDIYKEKSKDEAKRQREKQQNQRGEYFRERAEAYHVRDNKNQVKVDTTRISTTEEHKEKKRELQQDVKNKSNAFLNSDKKENLIFKVDDKMLKDSQFTASITAKLFNTKKEIDLLKTKLFDSKPKPLFETHKETKLKSGVRVREPRVPHKTPSAPTAPATIGKPGDKEKPKPKIKDPIQL